MTASRFPPPIDAAARHTPAPVFPMWPYACTAYLEHCSLDYVDYVDRLSRADDAAAVIAAEEALGLNLLADMRQTLYALVWAPFGAVLAGGTKRDAQAS
jgi:hypothetical protein